MPGARTSGNAMRRREGEVTQLNTIQKHITRGHSAVVSQAEMKFTSISECEELSFAVQYAVNASHWAFIFKESVLMSGMFQGLKS